MEFPNVLAFEAETAVKILREAGYECSIVVTEPPKFKDRPQEGCPCEYVVRQRKLDNNKAEITVVIRLQTLPPVIWKATVPLGRFIGLTGIRAVLC